MAKPTLYLDTRDSVVYGLRRPTTIEIICGDCSVRTDESGDFELLPIRTLLAMDDRCYTCGGRSYVIASELCASLRNTILERRTPASTNGLVESENKNPEVEVWEVPTSPEVFVESTMAAKSGVDSEPSRHLALHIN
jgi:hypothetical protein